MNIRQKLLTLGVSYALATTGLFVAKYEGIVLGTYIDPVGIITSCYGHVDKSLKLGQKLTEDQCLETLAKDLSSHNIQMMSEVKVPLSEQEHSAYLSFHYNVGSSNFKSSTLLRKLNNRERVEACNQLTRWVYAKGRKLQGLVNRRNDEKALCLSGVNNFKE